MHYYDYRQEQIHFTQSKKNHIPRSNTPASHQEPHSVVVYLSVAVDSIKSSLHCQYCPAIYTLEQPAIGEHSVSC